MPQSANLFLIGYDYGMGGLWGVILAPSKEAILARYPELGIADQRPEWMTDDIYARLCADVYDLDAPPRGMLEALVRDRSHP